MSKSILITGGASSGKTRYAITGFAPFDYVLFMSMGEEVSADIRHRIEFGNEKNGVEWDVIRSDSLSPADEVKDHKFVIFDSLSSYASMVMKEFCHEGEEPNAEEIRNIEKRIFDDITAIREKVTENRGDLMITTLETGFSFLPRDGYIAAYREIVGHVNQRVANTSDEVYFSASGIQFRIK